MGHKCHALQCNNACPPAYLMCAKHWAMVPPATQRAVYATVKLRGPNCDKTWAPWWRAAHAAIAHVARIEHGDSDRLARWLEKQMETAKQLETER